MRLYKILAKKITLKNHKQPNLKYTWLSRKKNPKPMKQTSY